MNQNQQLQSSPLPCEGNLLWFMFKHMNNDKVVNITIDDIMRAFKIDSFEAQELIENVSDQKNLMNFVEKIEVNKYRLTDSGMAEIGFLKRFVPVLSKGEINQDNVVEIFGKLKEWLNGFNRKRISFEDAWFLTRLNTENANWTDEEIEAAWRMYQGNVQADTQMAKEDEVH